LPVAPLSNRVEPEAAADAWQEPRAAATPEPPVAPGFEDVYRTYFEDVRRWVRALGGPDGDRDDLVQDVFVIVHRRLRDFDGENLAGWLYQITRHRVRDFRRLRWFRLLLRGAEMHDGLVSPSETPEASLNTKDKARLLTQLLSKVPEAQRAAFVLFEIEGYNGEEIARLQGVPINTVWARIHKARARLASKAARFRKDR
jgi:RNA polymerase sigma-70 factor, ECF subfamily